MTMRCLAGVEPSSAAGRPPGPPRSGWCRPGPRAARSTPPPTRTASTATVPTPAPTAVHGEVQGAAQRGDGTGEQQRPAEAGDRQHRRPGLGHRQDRQRHAAEGAWAWNHSNSTIAAGSTIDPAVVPRADQADHADHRPPSEDQSRDVARRRQPPHPQRRGAEPGDADQIAEAEPDPWRVAHRGRRSTARCRPARAATIPTVAGRSRGRAPAASPRGPGSTLPHERHHSTDRRFRPTLRRACRPAVRTCQAVQRRSQQIADRAAALADARRDRRRRGGPRRRRGPGARRPRQRRLDAFDPRSRWPTSYWANPSRIPRDPDRDRVAGDAGVASSSSSSSATSASSSEPDRLVVRRRGRPTPARPWRGPVVPMGPLVRSVGGGGHGEPGVAGHQESGVVGVGHLVAARRRTWSARPRRG